MELVRGNRAVVEHRRKRKRLLLFTEDPSGLYRFEGEMACEGVRRARRRGRSGRMRDALVFVLRRVGDAELQDEYAGYITSRGFRLPQTKEELESRVWFSLWKTEQWPYRELIQGDRLYWYESPTKRVVWESSIKDLDRLQYADKQDLADRLRSRFGDFDENEPYFREAPDEGYCIAYRVAAIKKLSRPKPKEIEMPRLGWLRVDEHIARTWLSVVFIPRETTLEDLEPQADNLLEWVRRVNEKMSEVSPERRRSIITQTLRRDSPIVKALKKACNYTCQFPGCGVRIPTRSGGYYIEVAHIEPVHAGGKSVMGNLLVLCPNHHKEFDHGERMIEEQTLERVRGTLNGRNFEIRFPGGSA